MGYKLISLNDYTTILVFFLLVCLLASLLLHLFYRLNKLGKKLISTSGGPLIKFIGVLFFFFSFSCLKEVFFSWSIGLYSRMYFILLSIILVYILYVAVKLVVLETTIRENGINTILGAIYPWECINGYQVFRDKYIILYLSIGMGIKGKCKLKFKSKNEIHVAISLLEYYISKVSKI